MVYAILLDVYQNQVESEEYAVTYSGTLEECEAQTHHNGRFKTWLKSDFYEVSSTPTQLEVESGGVDHGRIVGLEDALALGRVATRRMSWPVAVGAAAGALALVAIARSLWRRDR